MLDSRTSERLWQALRKTPVLMRETMLNLYDKAGLNTASLTCHALEFYWPNFTVAISRSAISICLSPVRSVWLGRDLQKTPTWSKLSLPDCRHLILISCTLHANLTATVGNVMHKVCCMYTEDRIQFSVLECCLMFISPCNEVYILL